jgi:hypothetical protein
LAIAAAIFVPFLKEKNRSGRLPERFLADSLLSSY